MDIIQHYAMSVRCGGAIIENVAENDTGLSRGHLDSCLDALERMRAESVLCRSFDQLQVAQGCKFDGEILQCLRGLIYNQHVCNGVGVQRERSG